MLLRPGNAGSNTAADHLTVIRDALRQLPFPTSGRVGRKVLVRTDAAGCTHQFVDWLTARRLSYSLGFTLTPDIVAPDRTDPATRRGPRPTTPTARRGTGRGSPKPPACSTCPAGRPGCGSSSAPNDRTPAPSCGSPTCDGHRLTAFATNTRRGQLADLELRHRRRARCEDRIRGAKDTGLTNLPLHDFAQNQIWLAIVALALDLTAWMQLLAFRDAPGAPLGTQTAPAADPQHRRPARPARPTDPAAPAAARTLAAPHHHRAQPPPRATTGAA